MAELNSSTNWSFCHSCGLCTLVCPPWQQFRDVELTPKHCIRSRVYAVESAGLSAAARNCVLCGACDAVCPRNLAPMQLMIELKQELAQGQAIESMLQTEEKAEQSVEAKRLFVPGANLLRREKLLLTVMELLNSVAPTHCILDAGEDLIQAYMKGHELPEQRLAQFLASLSRADHLVIENGVLYQILHSQAVAPKLTGLGLALGQLQQPPLTDKDIYILNSRIYHTEYDQLQSYYYQLEQETECQMNVDLQRVAQVTATDFDTLDQKTQVDFILQGRGTDSVVVEDTDDLIQFESHSAVSVRHLAELFAYG